MLLRQLLLDRHADVFLRVLQHRGKQAFLRPQRVRQCASDIVHRRRSLLEFGGFAEGRRSLGCDGHEWQTGWQ